MFNRERFHNELAMRLGYERIVNEKRIRIFVNESEDPWVTLKVDGCQDFRFRVADSPEEMNAPIMPEIKEIIDAVYHAYYVANKTFF